MGPATLDDYRWLVSGEARAYLETATRHAGSTVSLTRRLREELAPARVHLVLEQVELRERARAKFSLADRMFFQRKGLEQASDEVTARYKAERFPPAQPVTDLCCGIGGDLLALAERGPVLGVDRDPIAVTLAAANCAAAGLQSATVRAGDAGDYLPEKGWWHVDPDRRPAGKRTTRVESWQPGPHRLREWISRCPNGAVKTAPASDLPEDLAAGGEREWIEVDRHCRQQVLWLGAAARQLGRRTATVIRGDVRASLSGRPERRIAVGSAPGRYVHEPRAAVLAAGLEGELAAQRGFERLTAGSAYLTSDDAAEELLYSTFEVLAKMPFDLKTVKGELRRMQIGRLEIKHRGLQLDPDTLRRRLRVPGGRTATLIVAGGSDRTIALLASRVGMPSRSAN